MTLTVEKWYDRTSRNWVVQTKDERGNQIGDADYVYTRREAEKLVRQRVKDIERPDFTVYGSGTVYLLQPHTERAKLWCDEHLPEDVQRLGNSIAVEWRYIADIVAGARADGYTIVTP